MTNRLAITHQAKTHFKVDQLLIISQNHPTHKKQHIPLYNNIPLLTMIVSSSSSHLFESGAPS